MSMALAGTILWLQGAPGWGLVMAMTLAYALCFAGLIFAYVNYHRRHKSDQKKDEERKP